MNHSNHRPGNRCPDCAHPLELAGLVSADSTPGPQPGFVWHVRSRVYRCPACGLGLAVPERWGVAAATAATGGTSC